MRYYVGVLFYGGLAMEQFRFSPETGEWCAAQRRRRKSARTCSTKARMAFWFVCVAMGVLLGGMRYNANPEEGAVWEKAYACMLGSGPLGGQSAMLIMFGVNMLLGIAVAALCGILANSWGLAGTAVAITAFAALFANGAQWGVPESVTLLIGAVAGMGTMLGWMARQEHKRIL